MCYNGITFSDQRISTPLLVLYRPRARHALCLTMPRPLLSSPPSLSTSSFLHGSLSLLLPPSLSVFPSLSLLVSYLHVRASCATLPYANSRLCFYSQAGLATGTSSDHCSPSAHTSSRSLLLALALKTVWLLAPPSGLLHTCRDSPQQRWKYGQPVNHATTDTSAWAIDRPLCIAFTAV